jgi:hypothetical protein
VVEVEAVPLAAEARPAYGGEARPSVPPLSRDAGAVVPLGKPIKPSKPITLTGMYNGLERLRQIDREGGLALTKAEREFHDRALIGVLKSLHDDIDAAVADAYGWPVDLTDEAILERLVALNAERAAEEAQGQVRWLRPEFQVPKFGDKVAAPVEDEPEEQIPLVPEPEKAPVVPQERAATAVVPGPWPKETPDQIRAIRDVVAGGGLWAVADIAARFKFAHRATIRKHLDVLEVLGSVAGVGDGEGRRWSGR